MRSLKFVLAAGLVACIPSLAHAQWYVGLDAGANKVQKADVSGSGISAATSYDWGYAVLGEAGYGFGPLRVEGELGYRDNGADKVSGGTGSGSTAALSTMANVIYDFLPASRWHPFIGAGIGAAHLDSGSIKSGGTKVWGGDDWAFAYQGFAGVGFDLDSNWQLKAQYRYFATTDYDVKAAPGNQSLSAEYQSHAILVGLTYKFGAPAPAPQPQAVAAPAPAPAPMPAPAPKPAPAVQKNFIVFFDFDKTAITPEAARIIQQAAAAAKSGGSPQLALTGHTDRAGSDKYNMALSLKRANAVKDQLTKLGIPSDQIAVVGKGESAPLVTTQDGVREPQNRRVEIVLP
jgi:OmpA-OmpF porin, OOP family